MAELIELIVRLLVVGAVAFRGGDASPKTRYRLLTACHNRIFLTPE